MLRSIRRGREHRVFVRGATSTRRGSAVAATRSKRHVATEEAEQARNLNLYFSGERKEIKSKNSKPGPWWTDL